MNTAAKGARAEHRTMRILEAAGYTCMRAAASFGVFDVIAIGATDIVLVQVKVNKYVGAVEMEQIRNFVAPPNARKLIHRYVDGDTIPQVREVRKGVYSYDANGTPIEEGE